MAEEGGDGEEEDWDNSGHVSEGKSVDDVGGGTGLTGISQFSDWCIAVGGIVLSDESNDQSGPKSEECADPGIRDGGWGS